MAAITMKGVLLTSLLLLIIPPATGEDQCGLYLAVSSTSTGDNTVWGIYAGKEYKNGDAIGQNELAVSTINLRANNLMDPSSPPTKQQALLNSLEFLEESFWVADPVGAKFEINKGRIIASVSGAGSLAAFDAKLMNAEWAHKKTYQRELVGETSKDPHPSRGAISPFYDVALRSTDTIQTGSEIFVNYGTSWEEEHLKDELRKVDFARVDETVDQMIEFFRKHAEELDEDSKQEIYQFITKDVMKAAVGPIKARKLAGILPRKPDELIKVKLAGGSLVYSQPSVFRSIDWLNQNGRCMDNIRVGPSTIKNAGRGAIATRKLKKDSIIVPVPLLQIPDKEVLDMHELMNTEFGDLSRKDDKLTGTQMLLNYCFGHRSSKMLFVPTGGNAGLINHSDKPNAKLVWSSHPAHQKQWLQMDPDDLLNVDNKWIGLLMEVVALVDIEAGAEIFIDYGKEWKAGWDKHAINWQERIADGRIPKEWPLRALDMKKEYATKPYKTEKELEAEPYPSHVSLVAFMFMAETTSEATWGVPPNGTAFTADHLFKPEIVEKVQAAGDVANSYNYTVRWTSSSGADTYVKSIPHDAFTFVDDPETSDVYTEHSFRHYIAIPDDMFPEGPWRNA